MSKAANHVVPHTIDLETFSVAFPLFTLAPLSLSFRSGERVALVGPNGAGKTTMMRAIGGRLVEYEGEIRLDGAEMRTQLPEVRARIGFFPEL